MRTITITASLPGGRPVRFTIGGSVATLPARAARRLKALAQSWGVSPLALDWGVEAAR